MSQIELTPTAILELMPQQKPFRFIDEITFVNEQQIAGVYTFKKDEFFYAGHFPDLPITPGVILLEAMAQVGVVALGIYLHSLEVSIAELKKTRTLFSDAEVEFLSAVYPGQTVFIKAEKVFWRHKKLRSKITMHDEKENLIATAIASGVGVTNK